MTIYFSAGLLKTSEGKEAAIKRTVELTGIPRSTLRRFLDLDSFSSSLLQRKVRSDKGSLKVFGKGDAEVIRSEVYSMYDMKQVATVESLQKTLSANGRFNVCRETLRKLLHTIGFRFKNIDKRVIIKETKRIVEWRQQYLIQINQFRVENRNIYYLDETWFDTHDTIKKGWQDSSSKCALDVPASRGKRISILHCGSKNGWVPNALLLSAKNIKDCSLDYHQDMTSELFENWMKNSLLPNIPQGSVVVYDNASYHSSLAEKIPNMGSKKEVLQDFLRQHDLYYENHYTKKQLIEVLKTKTFDKTYIVDDLVKASGNIPLRLPPYHCDLNPIEMIWSELKNKVRRNNLNPKMSAAVTEVIKRQSELITPNSWGACVNHVLEVENKYKKFWENVTPLIISVDDTDDSTDSN